MVGEQRHLLAVAQEGDTRRRHDLTFRECLLARSVMDSPDASRRFEREARMLAKLAHPRIVTIHDFGKTQRGCAFLVT